MDETRKSDNTQNSEVFSFILVNKTSLLGSPLGRKTERQREREEGGGNETRRNSGGGLSKLHYR